MLKSVADLLCTAAEHRCDLPWLQPLAVTQRKTLPLEGRQLLGGGTQFGRMALCLGHHVVVVEVSVFITDASSRNVSVCAVTMTEPRYSLVVSYSVEPLHKGSPAPRKFWQVVDHLDEYSFSQFLRKVPVPHGVNETGEDAVAVPLIEHGHRSRVA